MQRKILLMVTSACKTFSSDELAIITGNLLIKELEAERVYILRNGLAERASREPLKKWQHKWKSMDNEVRWKKLFKHECKNRRTDLFYSVVDRTRIILNIHEENLLMIKSTT